MKTNRRFFSRTMIIIVLLLGLIGLRSLAVILFAGYGNGLYLQNQYGDAKTSYGLAWPFLYQAEVFHYNIGQTEYFLKRYPQAQAQYEQALMSMSDDDKRQCDVRVQLGNAILRPFEADFDQGKINDHKSTVDHVIDILQGCLKIDPKNQPASKNIEILKQAQSGKSAQKQQQKQSSSSDNSDDKKNEEYVKQTDKENQREQKDNNNAGNSSYGDAPEQNW